MNFNLATFQNLLKVAESAAQEIAPAVGQWGSGDHLGAVTSAVQTAGVIAQSATSDLQVQAEAKAATALATTLLPIIFSFASLFAKKPAA
jgi:hypothetical protein